MVISRVFHCQDYDPPGVEAMLGIPDSTRVFINDNDGQCVCVCVLLCVNVCLYARVFMYLRVSEWVWVWMSRVC